MVVRKEVFSNMLRSNVPKFPKKAALVRAVSRKAPSPMLSTLSGIVTLVRSLNEESKAPNGRHAVWNGHAGEGVVVESNIPNGSNAVPDSHAGEGVVLESLIPNARHAVWNGHAGEGVVEERNTPNARHTVSYPVTRNSVRNHYIRFSVA